MLLQARRSKGESMSIHCFVHTTESLVKPVIIKMFNNDLALWNVVNMKHDTIFENMQSLSPNSIACHYRNPGLLVVFETAGMLASGCVYI